MPNWICQVCVLLTLVIGVDAFGQSAASKSKTPTERALSFLAREVPQWSVKNKCYSCHNNGDAARALFTAVRLGLPVDRRALHDTIKWLSQPDRWKHNGGKGVYRDKKLAAIQFGSALVAASKTGAVKDKIPLVRAARIIAGYQEADGSWSVDGQGTVGSPATYGSFLATAACLRILAAAGRCQFKTEIDNANRWLRAKKPKTVLDAAATLIGLGASTDKTANNQRKHCLDLIRKGQNKSGGWGPFVSSAVEQFDTAVVLLALSELDENAERREMIRRGRRNLVENQLDDGSWPETTRPAGATSYAQRISTTGWATLALLATSKKKPGSCKKPGFLNGKENKQH